ncbi:hypothetical protein ABZX85_37245 [Streptomyces sp. NPDC004539]|uniref:hypothetical protein n=1 Tax=Streptomyces sp. NPDC004539 TaxID=3154280 RepID=UPI0033A6A1E1
MAEPTASGTPASGTPVVAGAVERGRTAVVGVPDLGGLKALASGPARTGSAEYAIPGGVRAGGTLAVAFECEGVGRLVMDVVGGGATFTVPCEAGEVAPFMNEVQMNRTDPAGRLRFSAGSGVTWAFAAGWDKSPQGKGS